MRAKKVRGKGDKIRRLGKVRTRKLEGKKKNNRIEKK
jgi:hypothetical protein